MLSPAALSMTDLSYRSSVRDVIINLHALSHSDLLNKMIVPLTLFLLHLLSSELTSNKSLLFIWGPFRDGWLALGNACFFARVHSMHMSVFHKSRRDSPTGEKKNIRDDVDILEDMLWTPGWPITVLLLLPHYVYNEHP